MNLFPSSFRFRGLVGLAFAFGVGMAPSAQVEPANSANPVKLILDTDIGGDIDDALALALIHALQSRKECELMAVTVCSNNAYDAPFVDVVNTFYGRGGIPIGVIKNRKEEDPARYSKTPVLAEENGRPLYPHRLRKSSDAPEAVGLLRRMLASQPDGSVTLVSIGHFTNIATLLHSGGDTSSPLHGRDLVAKKVKLYVLMAGAYETGSAPEWNVLCDPVASPEVFREWPTPMIASGFEIGLAVPFPARRILTDFEYVKHHPIKEAYVEFFGGKPEDRPSWDPTAILQAVRPREGYFGLSDPGTISVDARNVTHFLPSSAGLHRYLKISPDQRARVQEALADLVSQPPETLGRTP